MADKPDVEVVYERLQNCTEPEEFFGQFEGASTEEKLGYLKKRMIYFSRLIHPDRCPQNCNDMANECFKLLQEIYDKARKKVINADVFGAEQTDADESGQIFTVKTRKDEYTISGVACQGDISTVYQGVDVQKRFVMVKVVDDPADNDLMKNEIATLEFLGRMIEPQAQKHLPFLVDRIKTDDGRLGCVLYKVMDSFDLHQLRQKFPKGIPAMHVAWMLERLLSVVGFAHSKKVIHGNIDPSHIMIRPGDHNLVLLDWSYSIMDWGQPGKKYLVANEEYGAPEIGAEEAPHPAADMYSIGMTMIYALGGDIKTKKMPKSVPKKFRKFIEFLAYESKFGRAQDAWETHEQLTKIRRELWGEPTFVEFIIP